jgi:hypothetical protein
VLVTIAGLECLTAEDALGQRPKMNEYIPNGERSVSTASTGFFRSVTFRGRGGDVGDVDNEKEPVGLTTLHNPGGRVVADLVFIHGLGGGSRYC